MKGLTKKQIQTSESREELSNKEEFSVNKVQIMNFSFLLHIFDLLPPNNSTPFIILLHKIFLRSIFTLYILGLLGQMMAVYVYWGDIPVIANIMSHLTGLLLTIIASLYFLHSKNKFMKLVDFLRLEFLAKMNSKYMRFVEGVERQIKMAVIIAVPIAVNLGILWVIAPFFNKNEINSFENNSAIKGESNLEGFMFVMWAPFDIKKSPQYEIIIVLQFIVVTLPLAQIFSVDTMFVSLMSHAAAQFKVLCAMLNDMHENISESDLHGTKRKSPLQVSTDYSSVKEAVTSSHDNIPHEYRSGFEKDSGSPSSETARPGDEDPFRLYLDECIKYHQTIIQFVDHLNEVVSFATFLKIINLPLLLCMTGFQMMQNFSNYGQFLKFASLFAASLFLVGAYGWFGQQVIDESDKVQLALYSTDWYNQTPGFKSLLPLAIMRASRPLRVNAGVFYDMSLLTFASLVNVSYKYFTMLIQLHDS